MTGIYKITNPNGKVYIGQSVDIEKRWKAHKYLHNKDKHQYHLYNSFKNYGFEKHIFQVIEECDVNQLNERERFYQEKYNSINEGLNCVVTYTDNISGYLSNSVKEKISNTLKGYFFEDVRKEKVRNGVVSYMNKLSKEEKSRIYGESGRKRKGRKQSEETKQKMALKRMKVVIIDGKYFTSMKEASQKTGLSMHMIRKYYL